MSEVTRILEAFQRGDSQAADELLPLVYGELRKIAAAKMALGIPLRRAERLWTYARAWLRRKIGDGRT